MNTHHAPAKNRNAMRTKVCVERLEMNEQENPQRAAVQSTFCLPQTSIRKPQKYDVDTIPRNETEVKAPCSAMLNFKSHFTYGRT